MAKVDCEVVVPKDVVFGAFANAVQVVPDGDDLFLDFCVYSEREALAKVVSRVRIHRTFLSEITARLQEEASSLGVPRVIVLGSTAADG